MTFCTILYYMVVNINQSLNPLSTTMTVVDKRFSLNLDFKTFPRRIVWSLKIRAYLTVGYQKALSLQKIATYA